MTKVYKDRQTNFTHIKNDIFNTADPKYMKDGKPLTAKAIGIFCYMWSLPDDWEYYVSELAKHFKEQKDAVSSAIAELERYGFLKRKWHRNEGRFASYDWILNESPLTDFPSTVNPSTENPLPDNPTLLSTYGTKDLYNQVLNDEEEEAFQNYKSAFETTDKPISNFMLKKIIKLIQPVKPDVFEYAIDLAATGNAKSPYNFIKTLLDDWNKHKLSTLKQVKNYSDSFKQSKSRKGNSGHKPKKENLPDWANESEKDKKARRKKEKADHEYKMQHDPEYRKKQEKTDKDLEDNLRRIRELRNGVK